MKAKQRRRLRWLAVPAALVLLGLAGLALFLDQSGQADRARPAQAIVVLGAGVRPDGTPGDSLRCRTLRAAALFRQGLAPRVICTGGTGEHPPSEAEAAAALAMDSGVPAQAVIMEDRSTSTRENARNAAAICRDFGWTRVVAVSDPYHLWRVRREFARAGIEAYPSPARDCERNRKLPLRVRWALREALLVLRDGLLFR